MLKESPKCKKKQMSQNKAVNSKTLDNEAETNHLQNKKNQHSCSREKWTDQKANERKYEIYYQHME